MSCAQETNAFRMISVVIGSACTVVVVSLMPVHSSR
jgi:hypothetical protein